jgi:hypothetical protein
MLKPFAYYGIKIVESTILVHNDSFCLFSENKKIVVFNLTNLKWHYNEIKQHNKAYVEYSTYTWIL